MRTAGRCGAGLHALLGSRAGGRVGILTYHRTAPEVPGRTKPSQNVTPERLRSQLAGLIDRGFTFWPVSKILACCHEAPQSLPPRTVAVTFDDGYATTWLSAWPILRELNVPATVFVATAYLDGDAPFPFDPWGMDVCGRVPADTYRPLSTEECRRLIADGLVELGAHTHTHEDFRGRPVAFRRDLQECVDLLAGRFALHEPTFAFPFGVKRLGFADSALAAAAQQCGVTCGLTTRPVLVDPASDPFTWGRFTVFSWDTAATLAAKLGGWYSWTLLKERVAAAVCPPRPRQTPCLSQSKSNGRALPLENRRCNADTQEISP